MEKRCNRCHRPMTNNHDSGMGAICRRKNELSENKPSKNRVVLLSKYTNLPRLQYLIVNLKITVQIYFNPQENYCHKCGFNCEHIQIVLAARQRMNEVGLTDVTI